MPEPPIPPGTVIQVVLWQEMDGQTILNTAHYRYIGAGTITNGDAAVYALISDCINPLGVAGNWAYLARLKQCSALKHRFIRGQIIYPTRYAPVDRAINTDGSLGDDPLPCNSALSIMRGIQLAGRGFTGHIQFCGLPFATVLESVYSDATVTSWKEVADALKATIPAGGGFGPWEPVLFGYHAEVRSIQPITRTLVRNTVRTMHRRTVGLGI